MRDIIIASEYVECDQNSTGYYWSRIISGLKAVGLNVIVLHPGSSNKYDSFHGNPGLFNRLFKQFRISLFLALQISHVARNKCILFTGTNPAILLFLMPILKKIFGFKWVLLVHDIFPDNLIAARILKKNNLLFKLLFWYFSFVYSSPDRLICIGRDMQYLLHQRIKSSTKSVFIPNWANAKDTFPLERKDLAFFKANDWEKHVVFQFFGNIGRVQGINNLLEALSLVTAKNAAFVFIGGGAMAPTVENYIKNNISKNIKFYGSMPLNQKNEGLGLCDVAIVSLDVGMYGLGVPSKCYFSLAAGKPLLAIVEAQSEIGLMLNEYPVGWRCDPGCPKSLALQIDRICASPHDINLKTPQEVFRAHYSEDVALKKISDELKNFV